MSLKYEPSSDLLGRLGGRGERLGVRESLAAPGAFAGTVAVRYDVAADAIARANLLGNDLENVTFTGR